MIDFYATFKISNDEQLQKLRVDLLQNNILIKNLHIEEDSEIYHYTFQGDWNGYNFLLGKPKEENDNYKIYSVEHFEDL